MWILMVKGPDHGQAFLEKLLCQRDTGDVAVYCNVETYHEKQTQNARSLGNNKNDGLAQCLWLRAGIKKAAGLIPTRSKL